MSDSIAIWLEQLGLGQYSSAFSENEIAIEFLPELDHEILKELGVSLIGHRLAIIKAAKRLQQDQSDQTQETPVTRVQAPPATVEPIHAERRQLTVMFCDLVGSTGLSQQFDPEALRDLMQLYQRVCGDVIAQYDGHVAQYLGDGLMTYFGWPRAHEDSAERAIRAGLDIIEAMQRVPSPAPLHVRIGIATGAVVVGETGAGDASIPKLAVGETPNLAARVQGLAQADQIVISPDTRRLVGGTFDLTDLGEHALKGIVEPLRAWRVTGLAATDGRFDASHRAGKLTPVVGREEELGMLLRRWQLAQGNEGQVVLLSGEPGIGKSRLINELHENLQKDDANDSFNAMRFQCSPYYANSALWPSIQSLERAMQLARNESAETKLDKLESLIVGHFERPLTDVRFIASLMSIPLSTIDDRYGALAMTPQRFRDETLRTLVDMSEAAAQRQPTVLLFEDAHWADPASLELLDLMIDRAKNMPLLMLITHRPEFENRWADHGHVTALNLTKLTRAQSSALVTTVAGDKALPDGLLEQILAKTDGVPLFVEELTQSILESGELIESGDTYDYAGTSHQVSIPATLRDSLMARLDRYQPVREVAQIGAAIGREFSYELIAAVAPSSPSQLGAALAQLTDSGLAFRRGTPPDAVYTFKHALVQDAAYDSLLKSRRQTLHGKIVRALDERLPQTRDTEPEILAHHLTESGDVVTAIPLWQQAGEAAARVFANQEAVGHLSRALDLIAEFDGDDDIDRLELDVRIVLGTPLIAVRGYASPEVETNFRRALAMCDDLKVDPARHFALLRGLWNCLFDQSEIDESTKIARRLIDLSDDVADPTAMGFAYRALGSTLQVCGRLDESRQALQHVLDNPDRWSTSESRIIHGEAPEVVALAYQGWIACVQGRPAAGLRLCEESADRAQSIGLPILMVFSNCILMNIFALRREADRCANLAAATLEQTDEHGLVFWRGHCMLHGGWAAAQLSPSTEAADAARAGLAAWCNTGARLHIPTWSCLVADAAMSVADYAQADRDLAVGLAAANRTGEVWMLPEILRLQAKLILQKGQRGSAAELLQRAIGTAQQCSAHWLVLRAARDLAGLQIGQRDCDAGVKLLGAAMAQCAEGGECLDFREAQEIADRFH